MSLRIKLGRWIAGAPLQKNSKKGNSIVRVGAWIVATVDSDDEWLCKAQNGVTELTVTIAGRAGAWETLGRLADLDWVKYGIYQNRAEAIEEAERILAKMIRSEKKVLSKFLWIVIFILIAAFFFVPLPVDVAKNSNNKINEKISQTKNGFAADSERLNSEIVGLLDNAPGALKSQADGVPFYIFMDPQCPACRDLERSISDLPAGKFNPVILPVGFLPGSRELSIDILCSKDPYRKLVQSLRQQVGNQGKPNQCEAGRALLKINEALFSKIGATKTPTLVMPSGLMLVGSGTAADIEAAIGI